MKEAIFKSIHDTFTIIAGGKQLSYYLAGFFFAALGILLSLYQSSRSRDKLSPSTPLKFSWLFLIWDNMKRALITLVVMFILFRVLDLSYVPLMIGVGIVVSVALDRIIVLLMSWSDDIFDLLASQRKKMQS
jgi:hypothetical protein